jgi:Ni,Fe-hydrogenase III component G
METEAILQKGVDLVGERATAKTTPEPNRVDLTVEPARFLEAARELTAARWGYLTAITGLDRGVENGNLEVLYHFCRGPAVLTLRVPLPRAHPVVPSICGLIPAASMYERELIEMFGVTCEGTPDPSRLFLPDDWPAGVYPLRKDFVVAAPPPVAEE